MSPEHLHILQHALGVNQYGQSTHRPNSDDWHGCYRNRYVAGPGHHSWENLKQLTRQGFMHDHGFQELASGDHCFSVTEAGYRAMRCFSPQPPKVTRARRRWQAFLIIKEVWGFTFPQYLRWPGRAEHEAREGV